MYKENLEVKYLVGRKVLSAKINEGKDLIILDTDKGHLYLTWVGDCCSNCFLQHVNGSDNLVGSTILEARNAEWKVESKEEFDVTESMGTTLKTTKGYVDLESRLEHNGYYRGEVYVSEIGPLDQYGLVNELPDGSSLKPLSDF